MQRNHFFNPRRTRQLTFSEFMQFVQLIIASDSVLVEEAKNIYKKIMMINDKADNDKPSIDSQSTSVLTQQSTLSDVFSANLYLQAVLGPVGVFIEQASASILPSHLMTLGASITEQHLSNSIKVFIETTLKNMKNNPIVGKFSRYFNIVNHDGALVTELALDRNTDTKDLAAVVKEVLTSTPDLDLTPATDSPIDDIEDTLIKAISNCYNGATMAKTIGVSLAISSGPLIAIITICAAGYGFYQIYENVIKP